MFIRKTLPPNYEVKIKGELAKLRNTNVLDLSEYFAKYKDKCFKLDYDMTESRTIHECEFRLCAEVKDFLRTFRMSKMSLGDKNSAPYEFSSIDELQEAAELILQMPTKSAYNKSDKKGGETSKSEKYKNRKFNKNKYSEKNDNEKEKSEQGSKKKKKKAAKLAKIKEEEAANLDKISQNPDFNMSKSQNNSDFSKKNEKNKNKADNKQQPEKRTCYKCGQVGHLKKQCPVYIQEKQQKQSNNNKPQVNYLQFERTLGLNLVSTRKIVAVKLFKNNDLFIPLLDSGAELSLVNVNLVNKLHLHVFKPKGVKHIKLGDQRLVSRIGFVMLPITILFPGTKRRPISLKQQFEVFDIEPEFIFGTDLLPELFPDDEFTSYMIPHASITSKPVIDTNTMNVDDEIVQKDETLWDRLRKSTTPTYSISTVVSEDSGDSKQISKKTSYKEKLDIDMLSSYDHKVADVTAAIDREFQQMYDEMQSIDKKNSNDMIIEDTEVSSDDNHNVDLNKENELLEKLSEYLKSNNIEWKGPFRSSFEKRLQRHLQ
jgi:hypothetical protein